MSEIILPVPMRRHLYKFVLWLEKQPPDVPIRYSEHSLIQTQLLLLLEGKNAFLSRKETPLCPKKYGATARFVLPSKSVERGLTFISLNAVRRFDSFVGRLHNEMLTQRVILLREHGTPAKTVIERWITDVGLDEDTDISYWGLAKALSILRGTRGERTWQTRAGKIVR